MALQQTLEIQFEEFRTDASFINNYEKINTFLENICRNEIKYVTLHPKKSKYENMSPKITKDITEQNDVIQKARRAVAIKAKTLNDVAPTECPLADVCNWKDKPFNFPNRTIRIGTLFSGIGAIEHAFQRLKLNTEIVFAGDIDEKCKQSYFANYDINPNDWFSDIRQFDASKYRNKVDFVIGGAPCQAFSMVGRRLGFEDARGTLFYEFARVIKETQPKVFLFENVKGLTNHDNGRTWKVIYSIFQELGYDIHFRVLNSKDYGIPQHRERIYCLGFRTPTNFVFPSPISLEYEMYDFLEDYINTKYFLKEKGIKFVTSHKNRLKCYTQINGDIALCQKRNQQFNWHGDFIYHPDSELTETDAQFDEFVFDVHDVEEKYYLSEKVAKYVLTSGTKSFKTSIKTDLPVARPLLQSMHKMHRAGVDNYVTHKGRIRKLTPRECLRLMGFNDSFKIVVSDTSMYQQAGNSIVVDVLIALLKQMDITKYGIDK